jgi:hypothetical protein
MIFLQIPFHLFPESKANLPILFGILFSPLTLTNPSIMQKTRITKTFLSHSTWFLNMPNCPNCILTQSDHPMSTSFFRSVTQLLLFFFTFNHIMYDFSVYKYNYIIAKLQTFLDLIVKVNEIHLTSISLLLTKILS